MPAKFDRCVQKVKAKGGKAKNPYAICNAAMKKSNVSHKSKYRKSK